MGTKRKTIGIALATFVAVIAVWSLLFAPRDLRARAEHGHGVWLPASAAHIQCRGDEWHSFLDRGLVTMFEMSGNDLPQFIAQLKVRSRCSPAHSSGDPTVNGYNVWPNGSATFVPGNPAYSGLKRMWRGEAVPLEMLSC